MKKLKKFVSLLAVSLAVLVVVSPMSTSATYAKHWEYDTGYEYRYNSGSIRMQVGETRNVAKKMLYHDEEWEVTVPGNANWSSDRESVAAVDLAGNVTAIREGNATVRVAFRDGDGNYINRNLRIKVGDGPERELSHLSAENLFTLRDGRRIYLGDLFFPGVPADKITWTAQHPNLATFDEKGVITTMRHGRTKVYGTYTNSEGETIQKEAVLVMKSTEWNTEFPKINITVSAGQKLDVEQMLFPDGRLPGKYDKLETSLQSTDIAKLEGSKLTALSKGSCSLIFELSSSRDISGETQKQHVNVNIV